MAEAKRLHRSDSEVVAGVCSGVAEYLDIDPVAARIATVLLVASTFGLALIAYVALWFILPKKVDAPAPMACAVYVPAEGVHASPSAPAPSGERRKKRGHAPVPPAGFVVEAGACRPQPCPSFVQQQADEGADRGGMAGWSRLCVWLGSGILAVDAAFLVDFLVDGIVWWSLWPVALVVAGVVLMFVPSKRGSHARRFSCGLSLAAVGIVVLCISIGILSPFSVAYAASKLWPIFLVMAGLVVMNVSLRDEMFDFGLALCVIVICVAICTAFALPGHLEYVTLELPFGTRVCDINPWL